MAGAQFGVPGAIIGGGLGLITSSMGTGGDVNEQTGEVTNPSGIAGLFGHSKRYLQNRGAKIRNGIQARSNAEQIASDYYMNNGYNNLSLSKGGVVPSTMAYLDDGELIRTPDGTIGSIPEKGKPTDSNLLNVPVGTQVLSDKLKVPGTKKTFAEMGKKLMRKAKEGGDIYAQNSKRLNELNNQLAYQELLELQESVKNKASNKANKYSKGTDSNGISPRIKPYKYNTKHKIGQTFATAKSREFQSIPNKTRFGRNTQDFSRTPITVNAPIGNVDSSNERGSYFNYTGNPGKINVNRKLTPSSAGV
jgi:hypothetical protein